MCDYCNIGIFEGKTLKEIYNYSNLILDYTTKDEFNYDYYNDFIEELKDNLFLSQFEFKFKGDYLDKKIKSFFKFIALNFNKIYDYYSDTDQCGEDPAVATYSIKDAIKILFERNFNLTATDAFLDGCTVAALFQFCTFKNLSTGKNASKFEEYGLKWHFELIDWDFINLDLFKNLKIASKYINLDELKQNELDCHNYLDTFLKSYNIQDYLKTLDYIYNPLEDEEFTTKLNALSSDITAYLDGAEDEDFIEIYYREKLNSKDFYEWQKREQNYKKQFENKKYYTSEEVEEEKEEIKTIEEIINNQVAFKEEVIKNINFNLKYTANKNLDKRSFKTLKSVENNLNECLNKLYDTVDYCYNSNIINLNYDPQDLFNKYDCEFSKIIANYTVNLSYIEDCLESNKFEFIRNFNYYYESYIKKLQCNNLNYDKEKTLNYLEKLNNFCKQIKSYISEIWSITDKILKPFKEKENRIKEEKERIRKEEENRIKREEEEKERKSLKRKLNIKDYRDINTAKQVIMDASCFLHKDIKENKVNIKDIEKVISFYNYYFEKAKDYTNNFTKASYNKDYFSFVKSCNYYLEKIITKYNELTNNNFVLNTTDADYDTLYQKEYEEYKRILEENRRKEKIREEKHKEYIKTLEEKLDKININITEEKAIFDYLNNLEFENYRNKGYINRAVHHDIWAAALDIEKKYNNKSYIICLQVYKCLNKYLGRKFNFTKQTNNDYNKYYLDYEKFDNVIHDFCGHANLDFFIKDLEKAVTILEEEKQKADASVKKVNTEVIKQVIITVLKSLVNIKTSLIKYIIIREVTKEKELLIIHNITKRSRPPPENFRRLSNKGQASEPLL